MFNHMVHIEMQAQELNVDESNGLPQNQRYVAEEKGFGRRLIRTIQKVPFGKKMNKTGCKINEKMKQDRDRYAAV